MSESEEVFLSIDVDFWEDPFEMARFVEPIVRNKRINVNAIMNHQQALQFVNKSNTNVLINIDTHSDLTTQDCCELNCGTWVSYVKWRKRGKYFWIRSHHDISTGNCNFSLSKKWNYDNDWNETKTEYNTKITPNDFNYKEVCICLSPTYSSKRVYDEARKLIKKYNVPYKKGKMCEDYAVRRINTNYKKPSSQALAALGGPL
jgi:hypothetical protein